LAGDRLAGAGVDQRGAALEPAGADPDERQPVAVPRVEVGLDLEHQPAEGRVEVPGVPSTSGGRSVAGASSTTASSSSRTPKFDSAEPKNTGVAVPARNASTSTSAPIASSSSTSSRTVLGDLVDAALVLLACAIGHRRGVGGLEAVGVPVRRSTTPWKRPSGLIGQVTGCPTSPRVASMSSRISSGSGTRPVHLVHEGDDRGAAGRQTAYSFSVWGSTPRAASMTITAASTPDSTR
jgi:hypothetical protein